MLGVVLCTVAAGVAMAGGDDRRKGKTKKATATLVNGEGKRLGKVTLTQFRGKVKGPAFTSAGGHFAAPNTTHGAHAGDLPPLLVNADGTASAAFETDRFTLAQLRDADGSALIVHAGADNFANIPPRYGTPDADTLATGDAGARAACGVIKIR